MSPISDFTKFRSVEASPIYADRRTDITKTIRTFRDYENAPQTFDPSFTQPSSLAFFFYPAFTTLYESAPPHSRGSEITHKEAPQSVGLLWTSDQPVAETST